MGFVEHNRSSFPTREANCRCRPGPGWTTYRKNTWLIPGLQQRLIRVERQRATVKAAASNFDLLSFLAPVLLNAKLILRQICQIGWNDQPAPSILDEWNKWAASLPALNALQIPRCYCADPYDVNAVDLIMFSDASEKAFGAIGYLRFELLDGQVKVALVKAKTRVAPLKNVSNPRLDLCACLLSVRLADVIKRELHIPIRRVILFTDSTTNLRWFNSLHCRFTPYVASRVGEILESYDATHWRYVETHLKPADDVSRGIAAEEFTVSHRLFTGPAFLLKTPNSWSKMPKSFVAAESPDPEIRTLLWTGATQQKPGTIDTLFMKCILFSRIKRIVAYMLRWRFHAQNRIKMERRSGELKVAEIQEALYRLIKLAQAKVYPKKMDAMQKNNTLDPASSLAKVTPYLDKRELICVGGRLEDAPVPFDTRHPIILPF